MRRLNLFLALSLVAFSLWGYTQLPTVIPVHFNAAGKVNGTGSRMTFLVMPVIGLLTIALLMWIVGLTTRNPKLVNLPDKKRFMELPEPEQQWVIEPLRSSMDWLAGLLLVLFWVIQLSMYWSALGRDVSSLLTVTMILMIPAMTVAPIVMLVQIQRRMNEAVKRTKGGPQVVIR